MRRIIMAIGQNSSGGKLAVPLAIGGSTSKHDTPAKSNGIIISLIAYQSSWRRSLDSADVLAFVSLSACSLEVEV
jgi:hypothetical protein